MPGANSIRFLDILTTASAAANYEGSPEIRAKHLIQAVAVLCGELSVEDLGRPVSPLVASRSPQGVVSPAVREVVQYWYRTLGGDPAATLDEEALAVFVEELHAVDDATGA